ncbi:permease [Sulfuricella denitrificans skB26]|uniref:Permease n=1 Tax=Sulfuricella denitrificans (strain DSM 22764 / NBRC 105220 / skB26) TaxID=1163617 RepID=S6B1C9_SULDS|nr:AI-2E family transporter [Sulfuricella denitrificans]BAN34502.1 permease [Sulfuricella denitrificans skB26]
MTLTHRQASWLLTALALLLILKLKLLPALLVGLLVYHLIHLIAARLAIAKLSGRNAKILSVILVSGLVITLLVAGVIGILTILRAESGGPAAFMKKLAEILESSRSSLPEWIYSALPHDGDALKVYLAEWLRGHSGELKIMGKEAGHTLAHVLIGMVIGAMLSLYEMVAIEVRKPFVTALTERAVKFSDAFRNIVFAQMKIAALNSFLTWIYLGVVLPQAGVNLPFASTLVVVTFVAGLIPILGNILSNTAIVIVSLGHSFQMAMTSLLFLVSIHKLEYFLNAKIVGSQIKANAWELLTAMLVMEAAFGLPGLVAAPVYYAYVKSELKEGGAI